MCIKVSDCDVSWNNIMIEIPRSVEGRIVTSVKVTAILYHVPENVYDAVVKYLGARAHARGVMKEFATRIELSIVGGIDLEGYDSLDGASLRSRYLHICDEIEYNFDLYDDIDNEIDEDLEDSEFCDRLRKLMHRMWMSAVCK
jgi:hypothetical protein